MKKRLLTVGAVGVLSGVVQAQDELEYRQAAASVTKVVKIVKVSSKATGGFEAESTDAKTLVPAITATKKGVIAIEAKKQIWCFQNDGQQGNLCVGANGFPNEGTGADPLEGVVAPLQLASTRAGALFGAFVPRTVTDMAGFEPRNSINMKSGMGISPASLFFIGERGYLEVNRPGTLYLGANDINAQDNTGELSVTVTFTPD